MRVRSVIAAVLMAFALAGLGCTSSVHRPQPQPQLQQRGAVPDGPTVDCASGFSVATLRTWDFAFDGTVTQIRDAAGPYGRVVFSVHGWYRGGRGEAMTVRMLPPYSDAYSTGTRLLVAGRYLPRLTGPRRVVAGCGFTRYFDRHTAASWRQVLA